MTDDNTVQISPEVTAANHAALASFFEERSLVASQRYMDAVRELSRVTAENHQLRITVADLSPDGDEHANTAANLKRVNIENEELRASIVQMKKLTGADAEASALADLLRQFVAAGDATARAAKSLLSDAEMLISPSEPHEDAGTGEGGAEGGAN